MSWITETRTKVADALESLPEFADETILREWIPDFDREKLLAREIHIAPTARRTTLQSRHSNLHSIDVSIGFIDPKIASTQDEQAASAQDLVDVIIEAFLGNRIGGMYCSAAEQTTVITVEHWRESELVSAFLTVTLES